MESIKNQYIYERNNRKVRRIINNSQTIFTEHQMEMINKVRNQLNELKYGDSVRTKMNERLDDKTMNNPLNARQ